MTVIKKKKRKVYGGKVFLVITILAVITALSFILYAFFFASNKIYETVYPEEYKEYVEKYSKEYDIDKALVYAIIKTESNFNPSAQSGVGAVGLMQLMPETFDWLQNRKLGEVTMDTDALLDPETNIQYGCEFLSFLLDRYEDERSSVAAYNAGFGAVDQWLQNEAYSSDGMHLSNIPYPETANYVVKVENAKAVYQKQMAGDKTAAEAIATETEKNY